MLDTNVNNKFGKEGLTFDDVLSQASRIVHLIWWISIHTLLRI